MIARADAEPMDDAPAARAGGAAPHESGAGLPGVPNGRDQRSYANLVSGGHAQQMTVPPTALQHTTTWLREVLAHGPRPVTEVERLAQEAGIARRTLRRARAKLGVKQWPLGFGGAHVLGLPDQDSGGPHVTQRGPTQDQVEQQAAMTAQAPVTAAAQIGSTQEQVDPRLGIGDRHAPAPIARKVRVLRRIR